MALPDLASSCEGCGTGSSQGCSTAKGGRPWKKEIEGAPGAASFFWDKGRGGWLSFWSWGRGKKRGERERERERAKQLNGREREGETKVYVYLCLFGIRLETCLGNIWATKNHMWASWVVRAVTERATPNEIAGWYVVVIASRERSRLSPKKLSWHQKKTRRLLGMCHISFWSGDWSFATEELGTCTNHCKPHWHFFTKSELREIFHEVPRKHDMVDMES